MLRLALPLFVAFAFAQTVPPEQMRINAPYVTTPNIVVDAMLKLANVKRSDVVYDLGCGDGRIVIAAAKKLGAHGVDIDINPERIAEARTNAQSANVAHLLRFEINDVFDSDIHDATVVVLYLLQDLNLRLRPKLLHDLKPGTRVISHAFHMGSWKPEREMIVEGNRLYLWTIPAP